MSMRARDRALRRYPALAFLGVAGVLAVTLPSALTVPNAGPPTLAEFAPVPGSGSGSGGDVGRLGSGSSGGFDPVGPGSGPPGSDRDPGQPPTSLKRCVGNPPRQTEDPMSPPCVAYFDGDNGGSTWTGVTGEEVTVLLYLDSATYNVGDSVEESPAGGQYCDLDLPPDQGGPGCSVSGSTTDHKLVRIARAYSRFFNDRYQTYGRRVHHWIYWTESRTAAAKRADAEENFDRLHPFAVIDQTFFSGEDEAYTDALARRDVLVFPGQVGGTPGNGAQPARFFRQHAPLVWSFIPDVEHWSASYVSYLCQKVDPFPASHAQGGLDRDGDPMNGQARRLGLVVSDDPEFPNLQRFAALVRDGLERCGATIREEVSGVEDAAGAALAVAALREADVTTVLIAGAPVTNFSHAADSARFYPEIVLAGDGSIDRNLTARVANQNVMRNAWLVSYQIGFYRLEEDHGFQACQEGDPGLTRGVCQFGATRYRDHFMVFKVLQAAGPRPTPDAADRGMHAIPPLASTAHSKAACFFDQRDYSCVKDAMEAWWDGGGRPPGARSPGCWRMVRGGRRSLSWRWSGGDDVFARPDDPCNAYTLGGPYDP